MGVHTGAAEMRDGDYYGTAVNRAARIMSVAHGGQIVVSLDDAASSSATRRSTLLDLGEHRLRDLGEPERIFQVVHPDSAARVPAAAVGRELPDEPARCRRRRSSGATTTWPT